MSRAALLDSYYLLSCALVLTLFLFQKGQGFFPPLPIAALLPRSWHWADLNGGAWDASERLGWLRSAKGQRGFQIMLACGASRRACRTTAVCARRQTGNHTRPASREACRRAAVTPQPSRFPSSTPAPYGRGVGFRGSPPAASREARRRAAALGTKAAGTRGHPPNVPKAPYLPV